VALTVSSDTWRVDLYSASMRALTGAEGTYHQEIQSNGDGSLGALTLIAQLLDPPGSKWLWRVKDVYVASDGAGEEYQLSLLWSVTNPALTTRVMWHVEIGTAGPSVLIPGHGRDLLPPKDRLLEVGAGGGQAIALTVTAIVDNVEGRTSLLGVNLEFLPKVRGVG